MKLKIITYKQAWEEIGDDMFEILRCLERKDGKALGNIMLKYPEIDCTFYWNGKNRNITLTKRKALTKIEEAGKYYGYPQCCIDSFSKTAGAFGNPKGGEAGNFTGFIPCPPCADKVLTGQKELNELITNRKCEEPFPKTA